VLTDSLEDFTCERMTFRGKSKDVFWKGSGPAVILLTEIPGITPEVADFGRRIVRAGFTVALPDLFGTPGRSYAQGYALRSIARACISQEFHIFVTGKSSPVTQWLRLLVNEASQRCSGKGVGVIGMCLTGSFALSLAVDPLVQVPVMSQPSLPFPIGLRRKKDLGVSKEELNSVKARIEDEQLCIIGLRFTNDRAVPTERFESLRQELGDGFLGVEIDSSQPNDAGFSKDAHSVLTTEFRDNQGFPTKQAHDLIINHFAARL